LCICQVTHYVDIVRCKIERHTNIADARRKRAEPSRMQVKHLAEFTCHKLSLHLHNGGVKSFDMPNSKLDSMNTSELNKCKSLLNRVRHGFLEQHIDALLQQVGRYFKM